MSVQLGVIAATEAQVTAAGDVGRGGRKLYDITPACLAALGRRGDSQAMRDAKLRMGGGPEPQHPVWGSPNHYLLSATCNVVVWQDYGLAEGWLQMARTTGVGEGGPLYWPAGDVAPVIVIALCAELDGRKAIAEMCWEYLAWVRAAMAELELGTIQELVVLGPGGQRQTSNGGQNAVNGGTIIWPGPRAMFNGLAPGWYVAGHATLIYQLLTGRGPRKMSATMAGWGIGGGSWECWPWLVATLAKWIPAQRAAQPQALQKALAGNDLTSQLRAVSPGPYRLRYGLEVVRLRNGDVLYTSSHVTGQPKSPVTWVQYEAKTKRATMAVPDGYRSYQCRGIGHLVGHDGKVMAVGSSETSGATLTSGGYPVGQVASHRELPAKAPAWKDGALSQQPPAPPNNPEIPEGSPPAKPSRRSPWVRYRVPIIVAAVAAAALIARGC